MLVVAAGRGRRFGAQRPKQYLPLGDRPLLQHTLERLHAHPAIDPIVVVIAPDGGEFWSTLDLSALPRVRPPVGGGAERQDSVRLGLAALDLSPDAWVGIHDGARPLVTRALLDRLLAARATADALIAAIPAQDTVKQVDVTGRITTTLDRRTIWLAQTPQLFRYGLIVALHRRAQAAGFIGTDDASLAEWAGQPVSVVPGDGYNLKVTRPEDLPLAQFLLRENDP
ncbi:MAG: 2-C-methyl-D-erythritol 4-phosphate cytidylyltransferase [Magnetococcales bacterium]|nr:2-C-methyl-D-erythritol 4-phosphate cytidylyltransferase [Magnetococcales bacterium]